MLVEDTTSPQESRFKNMFKRRWVKVTTIYIFVILVLFGAGYTGYLYGQKQNEEGVSEESNVKEKVESKDSNTLDTEALQDTEATIDAEGKEPISAYIKDYNVFILNRKGEDTKVTFDSNGLISKTPIYGNPHLTNKSLTYSKCIDKKTKVSLYTCEIILYNLKTKEKSKLIIPKTDSRFALSGDSVIPYRMSKDEKVAVYIMAGDKGKVVIKLLNTGSKNGKTIYQYDNFVTITHLQLDDSRYFRFSPDGKHLFLVNTSGFPHAIIFDKAGKVIKDFGKRDLTHGGWISNTEVVFSDRQSQKVISYNIVAKKEKVISNKYPWFNPQLSPDKKTIASWKKLRSEVSNTPLGVKGTNFVNVSSFYSIAEKKISEKTNFRFINWVSSEAVFGIEIGYNIFSETGYTTQFYKTGIDL